MTVFTQRFTADAVLKGLYHGWRFSQIYELYHGWEFEKSSAESETTQWKGQSVNVHTSGTKAISVVCFLFCSCMLIVVLKLTTAYSQPKRASSSENNEDDSVSEAADSNASNTKNKNSSQTKRKTPSNKISNSEQQNNAAARSERKAAPVDKTKPTSVSASAADTAPVQSTNATNDKMMAATLKKKPSSPSPSVGASAGVTAQVNSTNTRNIGQTTATTQEKKLASRWPTMGVFSDSSGQFRPSVRNGASKKNNDSPLSLTQGILKRGRDTESVAMDNARNDKAMKTGANESPGVTYDYYFTLERY
jgi:hypothetical protein